MREELFKKKKPQGISPFLPFFLFVETQNLVSLQIERMEGLRLNPPAAFAHFQ
jgi:hypothetical protein